MSNVADEASREWDRRQLQGQKYIAENWRHFRPETKVVLTATGQYDNGRKLEGADLPSAVGDLEYSLGLFREAVSSTPPSKIGDDVPRSLGGDDVLTQAAEILWSKRFCTWDFALLAVHAIIKQQLTRAVITLHATGGSTEVKGRVALRVVGRLLGALVFALGLPLSVGFGLALAAKGEGFAASLCAAFAFVAFGFFTSIKEKPPTVETTAYRKWSALLYQDFHIGTGHGLKAQLLEMMRQGIHVPSLLLDLCEALHSEAVNEGEHTA